MEPSAVTEAMLVRESFRRTGRTTRLLGRAVERARAGELVYFVAYKVRESLFLLEQHFDVRHARQESGGSYLVRCGRGDIKIISASNFNFRRSMEHAILDHEVVVATSYPGVPAFTGGGDKADYDAHVQRYWNDGGRSARLQEQVEKHMELHRAALERQREAVSEQLMGFLQREVDTFPVLPTKTRIERRMDGTMVDDPGDYPSKEDFVSPVLIPGDQLVGQKLDGECVQEADGAQEFFFKELGRQVKVPADFKFPDVPLHLTQPSRSFLITNILPVDDRPTAAEAHALEVERAKQWMTAHEDPNKRDTFG